MSKKRKQYSPEFKSKIAIFLWKGLGHRKRSSYGRALAIAAVRGDKTTAEIAAQYELHSTQVNSWKRELLENVSTLFDKGKSASKVQSDAKAENDELYRQIGKLKVERDFLTERSAQLGLLPERLW